jgi:hypothetical protein
MSVLLQAESSQVEVSKVMSKKIDHRQCEGADETLALKFGCIQPNISGLEGKILTIIDASISDKEQNKAIKDLVRGEFRNTIDWFYQISHTELSKELYPTFGRPFPNETIIINR